MQVKFYEAFAEEAALLQQFLPATVSAAFTSATVQESGDSAPPCGLISVRTQSRLPPSWAPALQGVLSRSVGYDHLAHYHRAVATTVSRIRYGYLPDYCRRAVAEQAILLVMALQRKLRRQMAQVLTFDRDGLTGAECRGARLLVAGVGRIGGEIVDLARALGMEVRGVDIRPHRKDVMYCSLEEGVAWAQVLVCALPLTDETTGLVGQQILARSAPGLIVVNVGRGEVTPFADLAAGLAAGQVGGVALDVYPQEEALATDLRAGKANPATALIRQWQEDARVILTPHNAFNTTAAVEHKARQSVEAVQCFITTRAFPDAVPDTGVTPG